MDPFAEMLGVTQARAFNFFSENLSEVVAPHKRVYRDEFAFNVSVLAHYALVSAASADHLPLPNTLREIFDRFVFESEIQDQPELLELAGAQCLVLTGFFQRGMQRRHHITSYSQWGSEFFEKAASQGRKPSLLLRMARRFEFWRDAQMQLEWHLRHNHLVLRSHEPNSS